MALKTRIACPRKRSGWMLALLAILALWPTAAGFGQDTDEAKRIEPGHLTFIMYMQVINGTADSVTFKRVSVNCVAGTPESFSVGPGEAWQINITQDYQDRGLDNCYLTAHDIKYRDVANSANTFSIHQDLNSDFDQACFEVDIFVMFRIGHSMCPYSTGNILKPTMDNSGHPVFSGWSPGKRICPGGTRCHTFGFGFYISPPQPFFVTAVNPDNRAAMSCTIIGEEVSPPDGACTSVSGDVPPGGTAEFRLQGQCGAFYKLEDRTNVTLSCSRWVNADQRFTGVEQKWNVTPGGSYSLAPN